MDKIIIAFVILVGCFYGYANYQSGYCGFGTFNKFPLGLNANYNDGYWINDEFGFGVLHENIYKSEEYFQQYDVNDIRKIAYSETALYAHVETHDNLALYAIMDKAEPSWENIEFVSEDSDDASNITSQNWIETSSASCRYIYYLNRADIIFFILIAILSLISGITWLVSKEK